MLLQEEVETVFSQHKLFKILGGSQEEIVFEKNNVRIVSDFFVAL